MHPQAQPSAAAVAEAEALLRELKPTLVEMLERNDPTVRKLSFNDIEGHAAALGDLLAKLLMIRELGRQPPITPAEEQAARAAALRQVPPQQPQRAPADLQMTRIPKRTRKLKTARGEITFAREYLHFPELGTGIFPPGDAPGHSGRRTDPAGDPTVARKGR